MASCTIHRKQRLHLERSKDMIRKNQIQNFKWMDVHLAKWICICCMEFLDGIPNFSSVIRILSLGFKEVATCSSKIFRIDSLYETE